MKPKAIILVFCLAVLVLVVSWVNLADPGAQAAAGFPVEIVTKVELAGEHNGLNGSTPIWLIEGSAPAVGYLSAEVEYPDGASIPQPLDSVYTVDGRQIFRMTIFPMKDDWGATVRLIENVPFGSLEQLDPVVDRRILIETVAPHHPADYPASGFVRQGEAEEDYTIWRWEVEL